MTVDAGNVLRVNDRAPALAELSAAMKRAKIASVRSTESLSATQRIMDDFVSKLISSAIEEPYIIHEEEELKIAGS